MPRLRAVAGRISTSSPGFKIESSQVLFSWVDLNRWLSPILASEVPTIVFPMDDNPTAAKRTFEISFYLFALGGAVGLLNLAQVLPFGDGFEMVALAKNLANHGAYANPLLVLPTGPSAYCPPMYPLLLALFFKVLRVPILVMLAASLGNIVVNALTAAWLPRISWVFFGDALPGVFASVFWLMSVQLMPSWDSGCTVSLLLLLILYSSATVKKGSWKPHAAAGLLAGIIFLFNPMTVLVMLPWMAYRMAVCGASRKHKAQYGCVFLGVFAFAVLPWILRNERQVGGFVVRTSMGLTLYISNTDCSSTSLYEDLHSGCALKYEPNFNVNEAQAMRNLGELNYDRQRLGAAKAWVQAHPAQFRRLTLARMVAFWFPQREEHPFKASVIWIATILSLPGLGLMAYDRKRVIVFVLFVLAVYPPIYYVVVSDVRYRYPVLWLTFLSAGYLLTRLLRLLQARQELKPMWD